MASQRLVAFVVVCVLACGSIVGAGVVIHVDDDAPAGGDGATWDTAIRYLSDALVVASDPAVGVSGIHIAGGIYRPDRSAAAPDGSGSRDATFTLISGVALFGGYAGIGAPDPDARDSELHESVLSGDLLGDDGPGFQNTGDNSYTVLTGNGTDATAVLDGFTVTAGNADGVPGEDLDGVYLGGGMFNDSGSPTIRQCRFTGNQAKYGGGIYNLNSSPAVSDCVFTGNQSAFAGGAMRNNMGSSPPITRCTFSGNQAGSGAGMAYQDYEQSSNVDVTDCVFSSNVCPQGPGGGMHIEGADTTLIARCVFDGNAGIGGGALFASGQSMVIIDCTITDNESDGGGALAMSVADVNIINCLLANNFSGFIGGGVVSSSDATYVNCVFSRNTANLGGGLYTTSAPTLINCTFSGNSGYGLMTHKSNNSAGPTLVNCILWGDTPGPFAEDPAQPGNTPTFNHCDIQGGWTGPGADNIDVDPLFVQFGTNDVRLAFGSPCVNVGDTAALPPDEFDLDGNDNLDEPIPYDLDGNPRVVAGIVDMGAYEGEFEPKPPAEGASDVDPGDAVVLIPDGGIFDPLQSAAVVLVNLTGEDDATVMVTQIDWSTYPTALGYSELSVILVLDTSMNDGQFLATVFIPFTADELNGADPLQVDLTAYDQAVDTWALAVAGNDAPIGNRIVSTGGGFGVTNDLGDYGVYWDAAAGQGFAWAVVQHAADLAVGVALCPADCHQTPDRTVGIVDLLDMLAGWGTAVGGPCDVNYDGFIGVVDLLQLLIGWGDCPVIPLMAASAGAPDPARGVRRLQALWSSWGRTGQGGRVGATRFLGLLDEWGSGGPQ